MNIKELRLELLKLTAPRTDNPDLERWLARAKELEAWVTAAGQGESPPRDGSDTPLFEPKSGQPARASMHVGPAPRRK